MTSTLAAWLLILALLQGPPLPPLTRPQPPVHTGDEWKPLRDCRDTMFQSKLDERLRKNRLWSTLIDEHRLTVAFVDMRDPLSPRFAHINGDTMMYAASLPKIGVLLALQSAFEAGTIAETPEVVGRAEDMIRASSNSAATYLIDLIGVENIQAVLTAPKYALYDEEKGGGIWVGRRFAPSGERDGDPLKGISHAANATQVCRFYYMLATGRLVNSARSTEMLRIMSVSDIDHKFAYDLNRIAPGTPYYRKSGTWRSYHSDSVLVWGNSWRCYILVALVDDPDGEDVLRELLPVVESTLF